MTISSILLHQIAKKALKGEALSGVEVARAPQLIDKVYGNGDGHLDITDVDDIAINAVGEVVEKTSKVLDFLTSLF